MNKNKTTSTLKKNSIISYLAANLPTITLNSGPISEWHDCIQRFIWKDDKYLKKGHI